MARVNRSHCQLRVNRLGIVIGVYKVLVVCLMGGHRRRLLCLHHRLGKFFINIKFRVFGMMVSLSYLCSSTNYKNSISVVFFRTFTGEIHIRKKKTKKYFRSRSNSDFGKNNDNRLKNDYSHCKKKDSRS